MLYKSDRVLAHCRLQFTDFIKQLPFIIEETGQTGTFNYDIFQIDIISLEEVDMIKPHFKNVF